MCNAKRFRKQGKQGRANGVGRAIAQTTILAMFGSLRALKPLRVQRQTIFKLSDVPKCAFARRLSIQVRFLHTRMRFRPTPFYPNAFRTGQNELSLDACRSKEILAMKLASVTPKPLYL